MGLNKTHSMMIIILASLHMGAISDHILHLSLAHIHIQYKNINTH